ncbi:uncharacterized protein LOC110975074 [Acanthaster planci]|uniref:Uncharacterized protein LOC110975074 n=1 Tax=Acanthaster planci TaxID=133434 RepID=A0A8B7XRS8_ACAPL|nr:uncharacterized protein LOC110975074 [Acanthaster planci]XP_022082897.1 uncharacterized protein LOC110975074 [Acanthaster planci]
MKPTAVLTLAVFCTFYTIATAASLSRGEADTVFPLKGDELRDLADKVDAYNQIVHTFSRSSEFQSMLKRSSSGCAEYFGGCAQLKLGQDALSRMLADSNSRFGSGGPGKRRRSVDAVAEDKA